MDPGRPARASKGPYIAAPNVHLMDARMRGERTVLRPLGEHDLPVLLRWNNDRELNRLARYSPDVVMNEAALRTLYLEWQGRDPYVGAFMVEDLSGTPIGVVDYRSVDLRHRHCIVGIYIGERGQWGKGLGSDALRTLVHWLFDNVGMHHVVARSASYNTRAHRCLERIGFRLEGVLREDLVVDGRRWDRHVYGILKGEVQ